MNRKVAKIREEFGNQMGYGNGYDSIYGSEPWPGSGYDDGSGNGYGSGYGPGEGYGDSSGFGYSNGGGDGYGFDYSNGGGDGDSYERYSDDYYRLVHNHLHNHGYDHCSGFGSKALPSNEVDKSNKFGSSV